MIYVYARSGEKPVDGKQPFLIVDQPVDEPGLLLVRAYEGGPAELEALKTRLRKEVGQS